MSTDFDLAIIGTGIAGSTLAAFVSAGAPRARLALVDRDVRGLSGSTGHAPGVVAQINSMPELTELARRSVAHYNSIPNGFFAVGGLEVALPPSVTSSSDSARGRNFGFASEAEGHEWLAARSAVATAVGLEHRKLTGKEAAEICPFARPDALGVLHFPSDGTADAKHVTRTAQDTAAKAGAQLINGDVTDISSSGQGNGRAYTVTLRNGTKITARRVVVATGVWAGMLAPTLASTGCAFAHPYTYGARRPARRVQGAAGGMPPFVRFPAQHVYVRDHGVRDGVGTYAHDPVHVAVSAVARFPTAYLPWHAPFLPAVQAATATATSALLPANVAARFAPHATAQPSDVDQHAERDGAYSFTGVFTITPDGLPLVGPVDGEGLYAAVGCWVTHAAGSMGILADQILADMHVRAAPAASDAWLRLAIDPRRFEGIPAAKLEAKSCDKYRDIWSRAELAQEAAKL